MDGDVCQGPCERTAAREAGARAVDAMTDRVWGAEREVERLRAGIRTYLDRQPGDLRAVGKLAALLPEHAER